MAFKKGDGSTIINNDNDITLSPTQKLYVSGNVYFIDVDSANTSLNNYSTGQLGIFTPTAFSNVESATVFSVPQHNGYEAGFFTDSSSVPLAPFPPAGPSTWDLDDASDLGTIHRVPFASEVGAVTSFGRVFAGFNPGAPAYSQIIVSPSFSFEGNPTPNPPAFPPNNEYNVTFPSPTFVDPIGSRHIQLYKLVRHEDGTGISDRDGAHGYMVGGYNQYYRRSYEVPQPGPPKGGPGGPPFTVPGSIASERYQFTTKINLNSSTPVTIASRFGTVGADHPTLSPGPSQSYAFHSGVGYSDGSQGYIAGGMFEDGIILTPNWGTPSSPVGAANASINEALHKFPFASDTAMTDTGGLVGDNVPTNLAGSTQLRMAGAQSTTDGFMFTYDSRIEKFPFAISSGSSTDVGGHSLIPTIPPVNTLTTRYKSGTQSSGHGYIVGGGYVESNANGDVISSGSISTIDRFPFAITSGVSAEVVDYGSAIQNASVATGAEKAYIADGTSVISFPFVSGAPVTPVSSISSPSDRSIGMQK